MLERLEVLPVRGIGDIQPGADLASMIVAAAPWLADGDILIVTSKIVSKSEGRLVEVPVEEPERDQARMRIMAGETSGTVARRGTTTIVRTHHGFVMAAAGIDGSNVDRTYLVLLPVDPDASARTLRDALRARFGRTVAVIVSDTMGRPWRNGLTDVALGAAGIEALRDHRGETDPYGNRLDLTEMAVADELAAAGELVKGKCDQVPVAVVRGYPGAGRIEGPGASPLIRDATTDMFWLGTAEARALGRGDIAMLGDDEPLPGGPADGAAVARAVAAVTPVIAPGTTIVPVAPGTTHEPPSGAATRVPGATAAVSCTPPAGTGPARLIRFGADVHRLRAALAVECLFSVVLPGPSGIVVAVSG